MPNPDFAGTVPRMRCETCRSWARVMGLTKGQCKANVHAEASGSTYNTPSTSIAVSFYTTDLSCCSSWSIKDPEPTDE